MFLVLSVYIIFILFLKKKDLSEEKISAITLFFFCGEKKHFFVARKREKEEVELIF